MRRPFCRLLFVPGLLMLIACVDSLAGGEEIGGQSTWKVVAASETTDAESRNSLPEWEEPASDWKITPPTTPVAPRTQAQPPVASPSATVPSPAPQPTAAQPPARPMVRPIIPSRQLSAARQQESSTVQITNEQIRAALGYANGTVNSQGASQMSRRTPAVFTPQPTRRQGKPFQVVSRDPTITPWLDEFRDENLSQLPNYFTYVRPQFDQLETNRRNRADLTHLQREVLNVSNGAVGPQYGTSGLPSTGHAPRYMDTAQFYSRWAN
jgi:hypothetical protein